MSYSVKRALRKVTVLFKSPSSHGKRKKGEPPPPMHKTKDADMEALLFATSHPAVLFTIDYKRTWVLGGNGKWFLSPNSYLEWRIAQAVAGSSEEGLEERRERFPRILELLLYIAHANYTDLDEEKALGYYLANLHTDPKQRRLPKALKRAYNGSGILLPEMEEANVDVKCASCDVRQPPTTLGHRFMGCPCDVLL